MTLTQRPLTTGVETIAIRADLPGRPSDLTLYGLVRHSTPILDRFLAPDLPPGLSRASVVREPRGWAVEAEGNLTTILHGSGSEVGSLSAGEIPQAVEALLVDLRHALSDRVVPTESWSFDVTRYDPSTTLVLPDDVTSSELIATAADTWSRSRKGQQRVTQIDSGGRTATFMVSAHHSRSVYDKSAQAQRQGKECPPNTLRLESRVRPDKADRFSLHEVETMTDKAELELTAIAASMGTVIASATRVTMATLLEGMKILGEEANPNEALRLTAVMAILKDTGSVEPLIQLGIPKSTAYRYRNRLRALVESVDEADQDRAAADVFGMSEVLLARSLMAQLSDPSTTV